MIEHLVAATCFNTKWNILRTVPIWRTAQIIRWTDSISSSFIPINWKELHLSSRSLYDNETCMTHCLHVLLMKTPSCVFSILQLLPLKHPWTLTIQYKWEAIRFEWDYSCPMWNIRPSYVSRKANEWKWRLHRKGSYVNPRELRFQSYKSNKKFNRTFYRLRRSRIYIFWLLFGTYTKWHKLLKHGRTESANGNWSMFWDPFQMILQGPGVKDNCNGSWYWMSCEFGSAKPNTCR